MAGPRVHPLGWSLLMLSVSVGCALPKPTVGLVPKQAEIKAVPLSQNLGSLTGTVQGPAAGLIANNGASVLGNNGGGLIANNSAGLIANNSAGFRLLKAASRLEAASGARVEVIDAASGQAVAEAVTTGPDGKFAVSKLKASGPVLFVRVSYEREGHQVTLWGTAAAARKAGALDVPVNPATTLVAKKLHEALRTTRLPVVSLQPAGLQLAAEQLAPVMSDRAIVAAVILAPTQAAGAFDAMLDESAPLKATLTRTAREAGASGLVASPATEPGPVPSASGPTPAPSASAQAKASPQPSPSTAAQASPLASPSPVPSPARPMTVSTLAGDGQPGNRNGTGTAARFKHPEGMALDSAGNLHVADAGNEETRMVTRDGQVTRPTPDDEIGPNDLAFAENGILYAVEAVYSHLHYTEPDGTDILFAGNGPGLADGNRMSAEFNGPRGVTVGPDGNVYVADTLNHRIRRVTPQGDVTTLPATGLLSPADVVVAADGTLYVTEAGNDRISKVTPAGTVSTLVGGLKAPAGLAMDRQGNLYVADAGNHRVCKVTPNGTLTVLAGDGTAGFADGAGPAARFDAPTGIAVNAEGTTIFVGDRNNHRIRVLQ